MYLDMRFPFKKFYVVMRNFDVREGTNDNHMHTQS
jgi:hypothetical protein